MSLRMIKTIVLAVLSYASANALSIYLQWSPEPLVRAVTFFLLVLCSYCLFEKRIYRDILRRKEVIAMVGFAVLLSLSVVLGFHIVTTDTYGSGTVAEDYIKPYRLMDIVSFLLIIYALSLMSLTAFVLLKGASVNDVGPVGRDAASLRWKTALGWRWVLGLSAIIFAAYIPYLLSYWPALVFGDTGVSLAQIYGQSEWTNAHPVAYTLLIKCCLDLASLCNLDVTAGCAMYSCVQMALMSLCFGYLARWAGVRCGLNCIWVFACAIFFALTPYIASYSIAMWKDPLFSVSVVMVTLLLMDFALTRTEAAKGRAWKALFILSTLGMAFLRNNGIYVVVLLCVVMVFLCVKAGRASSMTPRHESGVLVATRIVLSTLLVAVVVLGPVCSACGVKAAPKGDSLGIPLGQMARVVVLGGEMSEEDRAYMDSLMPLEEYAVSYHPACIDGIKWNPHFNESAIDGEFFIRWFSMLLKNPRCFFEAWEFQTCGFWAINQPRAISDEFNIYRGVPRNVNEQYDGFGIDFENLFGSEQVRQALPLDEWSMPVSFLNWCAVYIAICAVLMGRKAWLLAFLPTFGVIGTLLVSSPLIYWPRYEASTYFLIPFFVSVVLMLRSGRGSLAPNKEIETRSDSNDGCS